MEKTAEICLLCLDPIRVPVEFICFPCSTNNNMRNCHSVNRVCLHCARTYLQLNEPKKKRHTRVKCLFCDSTANPQTLNAETSYKKDYRMMVTDERKDYKCVHDTTCSFSGTQTELERHLQMTCRYRVCFCNHCYVRYKAYVDHEMICKARRSCFCCRKRILHSEFSEHLNKEHSMTKCDYCQRYHKLLDDHKKICCCRPITCNICYEVVHHHNMHTHLEGHILYYKTQLEKTISEQTHY